MQDIELPPADLPSMGEALYRARQLGTPWHVLSAQYHTHPNNLSEYLKRYCRVHNLKKPKRRLANPTKGTGVSVPTVFELRAKGLTLKKIGEELGVTGTRISQILRDHKSLL